MFSVGFSRQKQMQNGDHSVMGYIEYGLNDATPTTDATAYFFRSIFSFTSGCYKGVSLTR